MYMHVWSHTYIYIYSKGMDRPGINKVANPARSWSAEQGKLIFPCLRSRLRIIWSRETGGFGCPSRVSQPSQLDTQTESIWCIRDSSSFLRRRPFIYLNRHTSSFRVSPEFIGSRHCVVHRHRTSKLQGIVLNGCPALPSWQLGHRAMDQII